MSKQVLAAGIVLFAAVFAAVLLYSKRIGVTSVSRPPANSVAASNAVQPGGESPSSTTSPSDATTSSQDLSARAGQVLPPEPMDTNVPPLILLQNARRAIIQYAQVFGSNPVGTNPEITAALMGNNPKHLNFITPDSGLQVNDHGEMVDAWGTPFFFHQLSGHEMEIHSAGPDRKMWTFDDLVTK